MSCRRGHDRILMLVMMISAIISSSIGIMLVMIITAKLFDYYWYDCSFRSTMTSGDRSDKCHEVSSMDIHEKPHRQLPDEVSTCQLCRRNPGNLANSESCSVGRQREESRTRNSGHDCRLVPKSNLIRPCTRPKK